jgi:hypothetical protein
MRTWIVLGFVLLFGCDLARAESATRPGEDTGVLQRLDRLFRPPNTIVDPLEVRWRLPPAQPVDPLEVSFPEPVEGPVDPLEVGYKSKRVRPVEAAVISLGLESAPVSSAEPVSSAAPPPADEQCAANTRRPYELQRSIIFYQMTEEAKKCSEAVRELRSVVKSLGGGGVALLSASYLNDPDNLHHRGVVKRYVEGCSYKVEQEVVRKLLGQEGRLAILKAIGTFVATGGACIGTVIGDKLMTARHCFGTGDLRDGANPIQVPEKGFEFTSLDQTVKFHVAKPAAPEADLLRDALDKDWILLDLPKNALPAASISLVTDRAIDWQPLIMVSVSRYREALSAASPRTPLDAVTIDIAPTCSVLAKDGNYLFHACQTLRGMSGSPLLTMRDGKVVAIGVHTGESEFIGSACSRQLSTRFKNYGVVPVASTEGKQ